MPPKLNTAFKENFKYFDKNFAELSLQMANLLYLQPLCL